MLVAISMLLLRRTILLIGIVVALLVLRRWRIRRGATIRVVALIVVALLRSTVALLGSLTI